MVGRKRGSRIIEAALFVCGNCVSSVGRGPAGKIYINSRISEDGGSVLGSRGDKQGTCTEIAEFLKSNAGLRRGRRLLHTK